MIFPKAGSTSDHALGRQRRIGAHDAFGAFDHGAFKTAGLDREILGEKPRHRDARRGIGAEPQRRQRFLGEEHAAGGKCEQPQIGRRADQRCVGLLLEPGEQPIGGARQALDRIAEPHRRPAETRIVAGAELAHDAAQLLDMRGDRGAAGQRQFARDQIDRLDAVGAFIDRGDPRIAEMLRGAGLLDEAHAAVHLHAERGDLVADIGRERLGDRREQRGALLGGLARGFVLAALAAIERDGGRIADHARRLGERAHGQQHAPHVGMRDDRRHFAGLGAGFATLFAVARISQRLLRRALGDADALQADARGGRGSSS